MKRTCSFLLIGILFAGLTRAYSGSVASPYEVGKWQGFKSAAVTYTFDDEYPQQFSIALPTLNEAGYNFKGTFFTTTSPTWYLVANYSNWTTVWNNLQTAANQGHEIAAHSVTHPHWTDLTDAQETSEMTTCKSDITAHITGQQCVTFAYPHCEPGNDALVAQNFIAARHCQGNIESSTPSNFYQISSMVCGNQGLNTASAFTTKFESAASNGGWCVFLIHCFDSDGGYSPLPTSVFRSGLDYLAARRSAYWVETFGNVVRYIRERDDVSVSVTSSTTSSITLSVTDNLSNSIYNYPVTIRRPLPTGWTAATVTQAGSTVNSSIVTVNATQYVMFDAVPDGGNVDIMNPAGTATGLIDVSTRYQTMDGFGGGITWGNNVLHANSSKTAIYDLLFTDLGLDIVRIRNVYGRSDYSTTDHDRQTYVAAKARNSEIKFLISSWSPPANLKDNGSVLGNGDNTYATLVYQDGSFVYNEFASYWNSSLNSYASLGLTLDYVSIQNEPDYDATWESCCLRPVEEVYNGKLFPGYNTCLDRVYAQLPTSIKFVGPEATGVVNNRVQDFVDVLDTSKLSVVAHHLYNGGDTANPDAYNANLQSMSAKYPGKTIWQTEFDQCSPFKTAWLMHNCIVEGRASAYIHWKAIWAAPDDRSLVAVNSGSGYSINKYYYYFKQFSKYISAGHRRIAASSSSSNVKMSAYLNPANTQLTVVLINKGATAQTMALNIGSYPITGSAVYRTSSSENFVSVGALGSGNTVTLPAQSVSTAVLTIAINPYTIDASAGAGGTISPSGQNTVSEGGSQTYTITPANGYAVADVLVDGASVGAVASYTFTNVNANHTISAIFAAASSYSITASAGTGGSISPSGMVTVQPGSSQTFTITPTTGYEIASVLVDGSSAGTPATYTFSSVSASHTISATFSSLTKYQVNCGGSASAPYTADQYYSGGTARTVTNTITTTGVTNPAPQAVYKAERYGTSTYTLPNLVAGAPYTVRLHFTELYQTASGKRKFNVLINGTTVLSNYDIYAAAGARYKVVVREFTAIANTSGQIVINFTTVTDNATVEGIEIIKLITNTAPTITTAASATPNPITATTTALSALGTDDNGEPNLTYTWATIGTPPAAVTFSANGTNAAKAATATFAKAGSYTFQVTATDAGGLTSTSSVGVTVNQTMTDIVITPGSATVSPSEAQQFTAVARDQFASSLTTQPAFTWDVSGGGTIDGSGLFTAESSSGTFTVTATSGSVSATAAVTINVAPTIATAASATPNPVVATAASLSALGADDFGESNLTYTWATVGTVPAAVMFSVNGTNAAKTSTVYFSSAGSYTFRVTVSDQPGLTVTSTVDVIVDQTVTSISVSPTNAVVNTSSTQQFTAVAKDQFVNDLTTPPAFIWSVNGGGTIDGSGLFTAGTAAGDFTVTATSGSVSRTEGVTVVVPNTAPVIATEASAAPNPVAAATTLLSVLGADDFGESNLTYTWATAGTPPAAVTFSANGTNAAKAVTATFTKAGSYTFIVTVKDQGNLTVTSSVNVTVNQTLTSITLSPASATIAISATQQFTATGYDQFATILSVQPSFAWSVSGVGTISTSGLYSAGTSSGTATITAASGSVSRNASVTVAPSTVYQINCGGSASSPYTADQYYSGGTVYSVTSTITTTGVTNPAPQSVYKTERYGAMTYTLPNLTVGASYKVRLHLAELYHSASGKRRFNVAINGTTVLSNYDIYAETGARYKAVVKEYTTTANASGQIVIKFTNVTDNAKIGGIEIIRQ